MPFHVIKGTFHVQGYQPDGDTIRFQADNKANWLLLEGLTVKLNGKEHASLRFEAIDALETHYQGTHQPFEYANAATDRLLELADIKNVRWSSNRTQVRSARDGTRGYIMSRATEKNRRPVAFVFPGETDFADGQQVFLKPEMSIGSFNYQLALEGLVYPTFYESLFYDLRQKITDAVREARQQKAGLWQIDKTMTGIEITSLSKLEEEGVILPKLFRRLVEWFKANSDQTFLEFIKDRDRVLNLKAMNFTHLDSEIEVSGN